MKILGWVALGVSSAAAFVGIAVVGYKRGRLDQLREDEKTLREIVGQFGGRISEMAERANQVERHARRAMGVSEVPSLYVIPGGKPN